MSLLGILVALIVVGLVYWCIMRLMAAFGIGDPIATVVQVLFVILVILWLVSAFGYGPGLRLH